MSESIDYESVEIPDDVAPSEFHYTHRRASLLRIIEQHGTPAVVNRRYFGERFDVSRQIIQNDIQSLAEYINETAGGERATATAATVYQKCVRELLAEEEWEAAARTTDRWMGWLQDTGRQQTEPDRAEVEVSGNQPYGTTERAPPMAEENRKHFEELCKQAEEAAKPTEVENPTGNAD